MGGPQAAGKDTTPMRLVAKTSNPIAFKVKGKYAQIAKNKTI